MNMDLVLVGGTLAALATAAVTVYRARAAKRALTVTSEATAAAGIVEAARTLIDPLREELVRNQERIRFLENQATDLKAEVTALRQEMVNASLAAKDAAGEAAQAAKTVAAKAEGVAATTAEGMARIEKKVDEHNGSASP